jgi:hypothetical protein
VLAPIKGKSLRDGLRPPLTVTARSVRRKIRLGRGAAARQSNKEMTGHDGLDTNRPIQVLGATPGLPLSIQVGRLRTTSRGNRLCALMRHRKRAFVKRKV